MIEPIRYDYTGPWFIGANHVCVCVQRLGSPLLVRPVGGAWGLLLLRTTTQLRPGYIR